jgi:hypothetical protein
MMMMMMIRWFYSLMVPSILLLQIITIAHAAPVQIQKTTWEKRTLSVEQMQLAVAMYTIEFNEPVYVKTQV